MIFENATKIEELQAQQAADTRENSKQSKNLERISAKKQILIQRRDEASTNLRNLGVLPQEAYEMYSGQRTERVRLS